MNYKDVLIRLASMTLPYVYDDTISFLELDRKLYKIVHELIGAMQGLNTDYEQFKTDMTNSFNEFTITINNNFDEFKTDVDNQISTFEENINTNFESFKTEIEGNFNTLEGEINTLKEYVDNYFENLNLDEEVQAVIQKMYSDGTLADIINTSIFTELNTKIDNLQEQVNNMELITTIPSELTYQNYGDTVRYYNSLLQNPSDNELFVVTFPDTDATYTDVELYYQAWSSGTGWKITNISGVKDVRGQTLLVQARGTGTITFEVIGVLPTREYIADKISDLIITNCGNGNMQEVGETYYVYSESFGNSPKNNQLFTIKIPELTNNNYDVKFYNRSQSGSYNGWELTNAKPLDISGQNILVQANVNAGTITFEVVGVLPTREIITDKISDLLTTACINPASQEVGETYYVYSESFGNSPKNNQLFTIKIPKLTNNNYDVKFYNRNQSGGYTGWELINAKPLDISKQNILVQAYVNDDTITFKVVGIIPPLFDFSLMEADDCKVDVATGIVVRNVMKATYIGNNQVLFMGSFMLQNGASGNITITPPINWGGRFRNGDILYGQQINIGVGSIIYNIIKFTYSSSNNTFTFTNSSTLNNDVILIMPQFLDTVEN